MCLAVAAGGQARFEASAESASGAVRGSGEAPRPWSANRLPAVVGGGFAIPYFPSASDPYGRSGFVRLVNRSGRDGTVAITAFDDGGRRHGAVTLSIQALRTAHFTSSDLEDGHAEKGLSAGVGRPSQGDWWLQLDSELDIKALSYLRTPDGLVTALHDLAPAHGEAHHLAFFNPASNYVQRSLLRLINPGNEPVTVTIRGVDDGGVPSSEVALSIARRAVRTLSASELEEGAADLEGKLGDGTGKWRLMVRADGPLMAMSLMAAPNGNLTNLSSDPGAGAPPLLVGLITKTEDNPFFVTMKQGALRRAQAHGVRLRTFSGQYDGDSATQIEAIETLLDAEADAVLITPSDPAMLGAAVLSARQAGALVIALDTPFDPADAVDGNFATDNFKAGELIGIWARARMDASGREPRIATLDGSAAQVTVDVLRNQGFLQGFGIDIRDPARMYDEDDPRIVGAAATTGSEAGGRRAMEELLRQDASINLVYAINEPAAAGAYAALRAFGVADEVLLVAIDGGCDGVRSVASGELDATAMQYPLRMAALGIDAVVEYHRWGTRPQNSPGLDFHDTGTALVTDAPVAQVPSITSSRALGECWG